MEYTPGVEELLSLAQRGRKDFLCQASHGDYSDQDQADAATRWGRRAGRRQRHHSPTALTARP